MLRRFGQRKITLNELGVSEDEKSGQLFYEAISSKFYSIHHTHLRRSALKLVKN